MKTQNHVELVTGKKPLLVFRFFFGKYKDDTCDNPLVHSNAIEINVSHCSKHGKLLYSPTWL